MCSICMPNKLNCNPEFKIRFFFGQLAQIITIELLIRLKKDLFSHTHVFAINEYPKALLYFESQFQLLLLTLQKV